MTVNNTTTLFYDLLKVIKGQVHFGEIWCIFGVKFGEILYPQSRDLVARNPRFFSAKLYDASFGNGRGSYQPLPPGRPSYEICRRRARVKTGKPLIFSRVRSDWIPETYQLFPAKIHNFMLST